MRIVWAILTIASLFIVWFFLALNVHARDLDGRYANSPNKAWFDSLASDYGLCCSVADGRTVDDPDIDMTGAKCSTPICVRVDGQWLDVSDKALLKVPNRDGRTIVWPMSGPNGTYIRCLLLGAGT